ncbi:MAG: FAD-binding protein [Gemmatimonadaceae bacterium]|nr:FAD-binding protein [Gemmatimonadaceae bacterium]
MSTALSALQSTIADAHASATTLRIRGAGTWLSAGRPVDAPQSINTGDLTGIIEYVPGDLVITAHAGTTLRELAQVTAEHQQWLALEPYASPAGIDHGTIGATIATASHGPLALGYGRTRDLILGLSFITGDGTAVRAGGQVVKNVAGFDLVRMATGAWGTLGVITQVSLRLHARPVVDETFAIGVHVPMAIDNQKAALTPLFARLNEAPLLATTTSLASLVVLAHDLPDTIRASHDLPVAPLVLLARATGNRTRVDAVRRALATLGAVAIVDGSVWRTIRAMDIADTTMRVTDAPLQSARTWHHIDAWSSANGIGPRHTLIEPLRGAVRLSCQLRSTPATPFTLPEHAIAERLPRDAWPSVPSAVDDRISRRLRQVFDASAIFNRGILGETRDAPAYGVSAP